jgi:hypothetical protein
MLKDQGWYEWLLDNLQIMHELCTGYNTNDSISAFVNKLNFQICIVSKLTLHRYEKIKQAMFIESSLAWTK